MGDVLTQSQIDALLSAVQTEGFDKQDITNSTSEPKVRKYDFHTPKKFTKDRLKLVNSVYENYARVIASHLTSMLRLSCEVELVDIEEQRYYEFNNALGEDDIVAFIDGNISGRDSDDEEPLMVEISKPIIYAIIDRMLGGTGDSDEDDENGGYTDIELVLYESVIKHISPLMSDVWQNYLDINFQFRRLETNPRLVQVVGMDEIVVIVILSIKLKDAEGKINICLPGNILNHVFEAFEKSKTISKKKEQQGELERISLARSVEESALDVKALLGEALISLEDLYHLKVNDVLNLHVPKDSDVYLCVEEEPWFKGKLGLYKENMAVKLNGTIVKN
ncbi:flagellar motor switch protein FliM [Sinanaerobacter sp. ZZT-01]|uniref:flagellar motor switch protein FliM n=1 Tax=Sinanaerobacter sp. ZZT-01 TaxID=3111540 RepID=UPI002D78AD13|nr:flagellar motor switch protein FliM [Sinanaerobacter sp. ZZT-01]WRR93598.1 flagellar motor switch protein FliM [Sinanaerobacter sp. ZZT-01]